MLRQRLSKVQNKMSAKWQPAGIEILIDLFGDIHWVPKDDVFFSITRDPVVIRDNAGKQRTIEDKGTLSVVTWRKGVFNTVKSFPYHMKEVNPLTKTPDMIEFTIFADTGKKTMTFQSKHLSHLGFGGTLFEKIRNFIDEIYVYKSL